MCGFCGIVSLNGNCQTKDDDIRLINNALRHRGPDDEGYYCNERVALGHRRLSIIDLNTGHQPIFNEDRSIVIVFNGEIYNYQELRDETVALGHRYYTDTDTETIIHLYEEYGADCVQKLNGMFAFAIWDNKVGRLVLARDRLGIKPLYYCIDNTRLSFASELTALLRDRTISRTINKNALLSYFTYEYVPSPLTIIENIFKLPAAHVLVLEKGTSNVHRYWHLPDSAKFSTNSEPQDLAQEVFKRLKNSVGLQMVSDVPIGAFLSGGIDSSSIVGLMTALSPIPVETFSVGFAESSYDELRYAREVSNHFGTKHHEIILTPDIGDLLDTVIKHLDEPFADVSAIPTYLISAFAREHVKVILSGDGGDEIFAGYERYIANRLFKFYETIPESLRHNVINKFFSAIPPTAQKKGLINKLKRFNEGAMLPKEIEHLRWQTFLSEDIKRSLFTKEFLGATHRFDRYSFIKTSFDTVAHHDDLFRQTYVDLINYLPDDILTKVDRMSMAVSLETRVPFLDHEFVEYVFGIPSSLKLHGYDTKYILKKAMRDFLPKSTTKRPKQGFSIPVKNWLKYEIRELMLDYLKPEKIRETGFFNEAFVSKLIDEHLSNKANNSHQLWSLLVFEMWRDEVARIR